jgi:hypothetical protein
VGNRHNRVTRNRQDHQRTTKERRMNDFEFERGREAGVKWGERFERERIIQLLETNTPNNHGLTTLIMNWVVAEGDDPTVQDCADFAGEIVALIKGENK